VHTVVVRKLSPASENPRKFSCHETLAKPPYSI